MSESEPSMDATSGDVPNVGPPAAGGAGEGVAGDPLPSLSVVTGDAVGVGTPPGAARVQGYELLGHLGTGGMGTVWRARQLGTGRDVALKLLGARHRHAGGRARFVREVRLCARLGHPNIARVYDSGVHQDAYYYAMELIEDGKPLDRYVREGGLGRREVLSLMRAVCAAVGYAHQKLVIHRDLKPPNILVTPDGQPHVLDFGLAKAVAAAAAEPDVGGAPLAGSGAEADGAASAMTAAGVTAGTVAYMSPEQAAGRADQADTRSDVYGLGKILFELLTGKPGHDLRGLSFPAAVQRVAHEPVRRPRAVDPALPAELEMVLLKALDPDPDRRFPSASALAQELDDFLAGRPVSSHPFGVGYVLRKWTAKHRGRVLVGALVAAALVGTAAVSYVRVVAARGKAEHVSRYLQRLIKAADPRRSAGRDVTVKDLLAQVDSDVSAEFASDPEVEATIRDTVGEVFLSLGAFRDAEAQFGRAAELRRSALGPTDPLTLVATEHQARACRERGDFAAAERLCQGVVDARRRQAGGGAGPDTLRAMNTLAQVRNDLDRFDDARRVIDDAIRLWGRTLDADPPDELALDLFTTKARVLRNFRGDSAALAEAEAINVAVLEGRQRRWRLREPPGASATAGDGAADPETLEAMHDLAAVRSVRGRTAEALALYRQAIAGGARVLGPEHPDVLIWKNDYGTGLWASGDPGAAREAFESILPASEWWRGRAHPYNIALRLNLARVCREQQRWADTARWYGELVAILGDARRADDPDLLRCVEAGASARTALGEWGAAATEYERAWRARRDAPAWGPTHPETMGTAHSAATALHYAWRAADARRVLAESLAGAGAASDPENAAERQAAIDRLRNLLRDLGGPDGGGGASRPGATTRGT